VNLERVVNPRERSAKQHVIADVAFDPGEPGERGRVVCSCDAEMLAGDYVAHRRASGLSNHHLRLGPSPNEPALYRRTMLG
jgi:hypothetical protein